VEDRKNICVLQVAKWVPAVDCGRLRLRLARGIEAKFQLEAPS
jgi:hypothetical protein